MRKVKLHTISEDNEDQFECVWDRVERLIRGKRRESCYEQLHNAENNVVTQNSAESAIELEARKGKHERISEATKPRAAQFLLYYRLVLQLNIHSFAFASRW
jgi:hypothetical protein